MGRDDQKKGQFHFKRDILHPILLPKNLFLLFYKLFRLIVFLLTKISNFTKNIQYFNCTINILSLEEVL
jgi:hypothetical protein